MKGFVRRFRCHGVCLLGWLAVSWLACGEPVGEVVDPLRKQLDEKIDEVRSAADAKIEEVVEKYLNALQGLEKKSAAAGNLDLVVRVREEMDAVRKDGSVTAHSDAPLVELRKVYRDLVDGVEGEARAARAKWVDVFEKGIKEREVEWTKAGRVDEALALRQERERLVLIYAPERAGEIAFADDPRSSVPVETRELPPIDVPDETPPVNERPFAERQWMESMTILTSKQRVREPVSAGDRGKHKRPLIVVSPGSIWTASGNGHVFLSFAQFVARESRFEKFPFVCDHASNYYFIGCEFDGSTIQRGGIWWGGALAAKFYLERCAFRKTFIKGERMKTDDYGIRAQECVFEGVELPWVAFEKAQPADFVNERWLRFVRCRFIGCEVPASFLLLTRDCVFENCTFVNDGGEIMENEPKAVEIVYYTENCKSRISGFPEVFRLIEKPVAELKVTVPTFDDLAK